MRKLDLALVCPHCASEDRLVLAYPAEHYMGSAYAEALLECWDCNRFARSSAVEKATKRVVIQRAEAELPDPKSYPYNYVRAYVVEQLTFKPLPIDAVVAHRPYELEFIKQEYVSRSGIIASNHLVYKWELVPKSAEFSVNIPGLDD